MGAFGAGVKGHRIPAETRAPILVLFAIVAVLAVASFLVQREVGDTAAYDRQMRVTQIVRGAVLRAQLNEETGMRGYLATGDPEFLGAYTLGRSKFPILTKRLAGYFDAQPVPGAAELAARERAINADWLKTVAEPLIADPRRTPHALALQRLGLAKIDAFRAVDQRLQDLLNASAAQADGTSVAATSRVIVLNALVLGVLTIASIVFYFMQARASRLAFETHILYENEKRIADSLQEAFLQKELPLTPGIGLHATYVPASREAQVGGDWYDALELPDGRILFSIGDVAGHGLDAAVVMSRARQAIVSAALHEDDPATVMSRANRSLVLQDSRMVTAICGYLDPRTREIRYATAGHPPPVLARPDADAEFLPHDGLPLGIVPDAEYRTFSASADAGAMLVLYTDGVLEHKRDVIAGQARLLEAASRAIGADDPALAIRQHVFAGSAPTDDVAILAISFRRLDANSDAEVPSISALQLNRWKTQPSGIPDGAAATPSQTA